ncbi:hypothetical protein KFL_001900040 [Klebsormidium nitens]|uniref:Uncharacterized protein n=1 Tax=Klebsormidium nitens TaxID=105231 RepID=A0A1Y1I5M3_KLENI|nr:hypothetical protein KFL_001900040 [Klebsormidium nitens]|eukprot:GAQ84461.1 hypothetical protein KFL_001900040 [Klebsormidium nitens]
MTPSITIVRTDRSEFLEQDLAVPLSQLSRSHVSEVATSSAGSNLVLLGDVATCERDSLAVPIEEISAAGTSGAQEGAGSEEVNRTSTRLIRRRRFRPWRLPFAAAKRASDWVGQRVDRTRAFLCHHWHLLRTGESATELVIVFSPIVAASSLAYLGPAMCFWATKKLAMTALFSMITFTSLQADSLQPNNKLWCMTDRTIATVAVITGPVRTFLHAAATFDMKIKIAILSTVALSCLAWSRSSKSQSDFVLRHTCWHIVSAAGLSWMALRSAYLVQQYEAKLLLTVAELVA